MRLLFLISSVVFLFVRNIESDKVTQERATVTYYDPNYVKDPQAFTIRRKRGETYLTNFTAAILHPWGNNITVTINIWTKRILNDWLISMKLCELTNHKWIVDFMERFMKLKPTCPYPVGFYGAYNMELPPKNFPIAIAKGESIITLSIMITDTKKLILRAQMKLIIH